MNEGRRPGRKRLEGVLWLALAGFLGVKVWPQVVAALNVGAPGDHVPSFAATTFRGESISLEGFRGKVVLVNFWATWCPPCRLEMPGFERIYQAKRDEGFVILGLSTDRGPATVEDFISKRGITFPVALATTEARLAFGGVHGLPVSFLIDRDGRIRHTVHGMFTEPALRLAVNRLLAEKPCDCRLERSAAQAAQPLDARKCAKPTGDVLNGSEPTPMCG